MQVNITIAPRLLKKMQRLGVKEEDIRETFTRSGGPGGQNVNKLSTCVCLKHIPTGIEVKYQGQRSQSQNRYHAREILLEKIENLFLQAAAKKRQEQEKIRRQKRKKPRGLKLRILEVKRRHSLKKSLRLPVRYPETE